MLAIGCKICYDIDTAGEKDRKAKMKNQGGKRNVYYQKN